MTEGKGGKSRFSILEPDPDILSQNWIPHYIVSKEFGDVWMNIKDNHPPWPYAYQIHDEKLYRDNLLCIPEVLVEKVLVAHHIHMGHCGVKKLLAEARRRYDIPPSKSVEALVKKVRANCLICQACDPPNFSLNGPIRCNPVVERFMSSVCLDVFSMPRVQWQGLEYDCYLLCVDRHSGWMIARPTQKDGLTGEKAAHMLLDGGWGEMGIPSQITSDRGPQFVSQWWATQCAQGWE